MNSIHYWDNIDYFKAFERYELIKKLPLYQLVLAYHEAENSENFENAFNQIIDRLVKHKPNAFIRN